MAIIALYIILTPADTAAGIGWTNYARGEIKAGPNGVIKLDPPVPNPVEDFADTASNVALQTDIAQQYADSMRYQFMSLFMPGQR